MKKMLGVGALSIVMMLSASFLCADEVERHTYKPNEGYVPNEATAIKIAEAVWLPIYGEQIDNEKPFVAKLSNGVWTVEGTLPKEYARGGVAVIEISKDDGKILRLSHGK